MVPYAWSVVVGLCCLSLHGELLHIPSREPRGRSPHLARKNRRAFGGGSDRATDRCGGGSPEIAEGLRPIYEYLPLANVSAPDMAGWLQTAFGAKIKVTPAPQSNAILLLGLPDDVQAANEAIRTLDQPRLAGRRSIRI